MTSVGAWGFARARWLLAGALFGLALVPAPSEASCQTTWCYQEFREYEEKGLATSRAEALANPRDGEKWSAVDSLLERAAGRRRGIAAFRARFDWTPQPDLARWPELEKEVAAEREAWLALWRHVEPSSTQALCRAAERNPDAVAGLEALAAALERHHDDEKLVRCLVSRANAAGRSEVGLAAARNLVERRGDDPEAWSDLIGAARAAHDDAAHLAALRARAERFPEEAWFRQAVLRTLSDAHQEAELDRTFARYAAEAAGPAEREVLCSVFLFATTRADDCQRAVLAMDSGGELSAGDRSAIDSAHRFVLMRAIHSRDLAEVERLSLRSPAKIAVTDWSVALDWLKGDACPAFLRDVESGRLSAAVRERPADWPFHSLVTSLETCGAAAKAHDLLDATGSGDRSFALRDRLAFLERRDGEQRLAVDPSDPEAQSELDQTAYALPPAERIAYYSARLQAKPEVLRFRQDLQKALVELAESGHEDQALVSAAQSLALYPTDLDWSLQMAFFDLKWKNGGAARAIAQDILRSPTAVPRQRDEAEFLLARLELRDGRFAEASERLERYFLDRVRYEGCLEDADCDEAMALDLLAGLDRKRLTSYLARRAEAIAYFRTVIAPATEIGYGRMMQRPWPETQWTRTLVAAPACRQDDTLARLRSVHAWSRPVRLRAAAKLPACPSAWGDLEKALDRAAPERVWAKLTRID